MTSLRVHTVHQFCSQESHSAVLLSVTDVEELCTRVLLGLTHGRWSKSQVNQPVRILSAALF